MAGKHLLQGLIKWSMREPWVDRFEQTLEDHLVDGHYRDVLDQPVPMLGGETPRAAVKTDSGRIKVVDWLKMMENRTAKSAEPDSPMATYSFGWLWTELGINDLRR